jgi:hypothetical protein
MLHRARFEPLPADSVARVHAADRTSHSRSLAFAMVLTVIPRIIAAVGLAT